MITFRGVEVGHQLRRVAQTPKTFTNWGSLLTGILAEKAGRGPAELQFRTRTGLRIECPNVPGARVPIYEIFSEDCYRFGWFLQGLTDRPLRVLDIGGHVGTFAIRLAQLHPRADITCFEPSTVSASYLQRNIDQNGFGDRIRVVEAAMAAKAGVVVFADNGGGSGLNGIVRPGESSAGIEVKAVSFDDEIAERGPVDVVKIDCEGGEYELVFGSSPDNWNSVQRIVLEYHPHPTYSWAQLLSWFREQGFTMQAHEPIDVGLGSAWLSRTPL